MSYYQQPNLGFYNGPSQQSLYNGSIPTGSMQTSYSYAGGDQDQPPLSKGVLAAFSSSGYPGEPPLLEELGINFNHIKSKTLAVLNFKSSSLSEDIIQDSDLAGPLIFCLLFGTLLLLSGKTHFGYIYGVALFGTVSLHWLFKLMSNNTSDNNLDFLRTASVIGYCLLPLVILSGIAVLIRLDNTLGYVLACLAIFWCTFSSSGFFVRVLNLSNARPLVAYPLAMFYSVFALMAIFVEKKE
ncbi:hypothetical protein KL918_000384 [Ogataea parapolymorpha]|uniref:Protein YIP n=1 Tax=Ogataea parapolymorpha (strain ATCC 26012 / BCRC 20466 / JCM 22074 / NRRL Y-7560 / DL-1) TaxID=871575 RepID=W1Q8P9_OGAPD|nr:Protein transport protein YIP1 [Ogataea parapolymorpha DL-1]ESW96432.1 Protein transport protein YIP1 [Ogataea parapolymorpha DL-1]KAG7870180.1 hypothetical protein KL918_000384 [Ogataea parapolymorpha]KAG7875129.1 hypothetical protein KL916_000741 [Ogataea parapolymorpha]